MGLDRHDTCLAPTFSDLTAGLPPCAALRLAPALLPPPPLPPPFCPFAFGGPPPCFAGAHWLPLLRASTASKAPSCRASGSSAARGCSTGCACQLRGRSRGSKRCFHTNIRHGVVNHQCVTCIQDTILHGRQVVSCCRHWCLHLLQVYKATTALSLAQLAECESQEAAHCWRSWACSLC